MGRSSRPLLQRILNGPLSRRSLVPYVHVNSIISLCFIKFVDVLHLDIMFLCSMSLSVTVHGSKVKQTVQELITLSTYTLFDTHTHTHIPYNTFTGTLSYWHHCCDDTVVLLNHVKPSVWYSTSGYQLPHHGSPEPIFCPKFQGPSCIQFMKHDQSPD